MNKFWIILSLAPGTHSYLPPFRYDSADDAIAAAKQAALDNPTPEGYAIMECIKVTAAPVSTVEVNDPAPPAPEVAAAAAAAAQVLAEESPAKLTTLPK